MSTAKDELFIQLKSTHKRFSGADVINLIERLDLYEKENNTCLHQKRQYISELNKDLCLNCEALIK